ncbi:MAG: Protein acetyltransferase [Solirubrobacterales bacterium]|nr:Protein acetyltransferase [Solirubrobacterales bacterium]
MEGITIRPIGPEDREGLAASFARLSPESRYLRFFSPVSHLSGAQLDYLTDVDHHDHEALLAIEDATGDIVGVARFVRTEEGVAEPAVVVIDEWQRRGIGSALLARLADRAREEGVACFAAVVLAHNDAALAALGRLGETRVLAQGPNVEVQIDLARPDAAGSTLQDLLRRAAEQSIRPAVSFLHRLTVGEQRPGGPPDNVIVAAADPSLERARALARALGAGLHVVDPGRGDLAAALLEAALEHRARLIVIDGTAAARTRFSFTAWDHVAHHAPCDVLVVR